MRTANNLTQAAVTVPSAIVTLKFDQPAQCFTEALVQASTVFVVAATPKWPGAMVTCRILGNGVNRPVFQGMRELAGSAGYDGRSGVLNLVQCFFDGVDCWYAISHAKVENAASYPVLLQFLARTIGIVQDHQVYYAEPDAKADANLTQFSAYMTASQAIPAHKDGQITILTHNLNMLGLKIGPEAEPHGNWLYKVWAGATTVYSGTRIDDARDSGMPFMGKGWLRLSRSSGKVTAEASADGQTWQVIQSFARPSWEALYIAIALTPAAGASLRTVQVVSFEVMP
ncbi:MAG: hypothetical protein RLZZ511_3564 [Cyanobacteriota bacterium]|jgi:hypothetical protein